MADLFHVLEIGSSVVYIYGAKENAMCANIQVYNVTIRWKRYMLTNLRTWWILRTISLTLGPIRAA